MGHHPAFGGSKNYFADDVTGLPESAAWAKVQTLHCALPVHDPVLVLQQCIQITTMYFVPQLSTPEVLVHCQSIA